MWILTGLLVILLSAKGKFFYLLKYICLIAEQFTEKKNNFIISSYIVQIFLGYRGLLINVLA